MRHCIRILTGVIVLATPAQAQSAVMRLSLGGGTATDLRGARAGAYVLAPSATLFPHPDLRVALSARGTRYVNREWSIAGGAAVDGRFPVSGPLALVVAGSVDLTRASYRATYLLAETVPAFQLRVGRVTAWAGARAAGARASFEATPGVPLPNAGSVSVLARSSVGPAFGGAVSLLRFPGGQEVRLTYREEHGRPDGHAVIDRVVAASATAHGIALSGTIGARRGPGEDRMYGGARIAIALTPGLALFGGAETYPSNPLLETPGGQSISAGLSLTSGGRAPEASRPRDGAVGPRPAGVARVTPGLTRLSIRAGAATRVEVAGDWNEWRPIALLRSADGVWYADLSIPPGEYRYAFRIDGREWEVPNGVATVHDGFGGRSARLSVRKPERKS